MFRPRLRPASVRRVWATMGATTTGLPGLRVGAKVAPVRNIHMVALLDFNDGVPGFLSKEGFDTAYTRYQQMMIDNVNQTVGGTPLQDTSIKDLVIQFSRDPSNAPLFNSASMAHNNHLFFSTLARLPIRESDKELPAPLQEVESMPIPTYFGSELAKNFSSIESFRGYFTATALAMFGPGFVWLVKTQQGRLKILCTYLAGTPYAKAHYKKQAFDANTVPAGSLDAASVFDANQVTHGYGSAGNTGLGGIEVYPLLCLNTWEHAWLPDYGIYNPSEAIASGKERYVNKWWQVIDWDKVADRYETGSSAGKRPYKI